MYLFQRWPLNPLFSTQISTLLTLTNYCRVYTVSANKGSFKYTLLILYKIIRILKSHNSENPILMNKLK